MFEVLVTLLACWLFFGAVKIAFKASWGVAKIIATVLLSLAVPALVVCLIFAGGVVLLLPVALIAGAFALLKACT